MAPRTRCSGSPPSTGPSALPYSLKILLENLLRTEDGANITADHIRALAGWQPKAEPDTEIQFTPGRVIMQDFTGVPCIVDLATMREAIAELGGDPAGSTPWPRCGDDRFRYDVAPAAESCDGCDRFPVLM